MNLVHNCLGKNFQYEDLDSVNVCNVYYNYAEFFS